LSTIISREPLPECKAILLSDRIIDPVNGTERRIVLEGSFLRERRSHQFSGTIVRRSAIFLLVLIFACIVSTVNHCQGLLNTSVSSKDNSFFVFGVAVAVIVPVLSFLILTIDDGFIQDWRI